MKLTKTHWITIITLLAVTVGLIVFDLFLMSNDVKGDTISAILVEGSLKCAFLPYAFGFLMGHLFLKQNREPPVPAVFLAPPALGGILIMLQYFLDYPWWGPLAALLIGIGMGVALWPNKGDAGE